MASDNYLLQSDLQIPYEAPKALEFCLYVKKFFKIPDENCLNLGDEIDSFHGGGYPKGADYDTTPKQELDIARDKLKLWYDAFPKMRVCISNHGLRWVRKAYHAEIPSQLIRDYKEIINAPRYWHWADKWIIKTKHPFAITHGMGYSGKDGHRNAAIDFGMSTAIGHLHANAGISYIRTETQKIWAFNTGCLIDVNSFAFKYGQYNRLKPALGIGVVINNGSTPIWIPYE
jgi:hypothetical protein